MAMFDKIALGIALLGTAALAGCATDGQTPGQTAAVAPGKAISGKFTGTAESNWGDTARCRTTLRLEVTAAEQKVRASIKLASTYNVEARQQPDGSFETSYVTTTGNRITVTGVLADTGTMMSVWNPADCGYRNVVLKG